MGAANAFSFDQSVTSWRCVSLLPSSAVVLALVASSPLRPELLDGVDMLIVRELTGGVYFGEREEPSGPAGDRPALDTMPYDEREVARIVDSRSSWPAAGAGQVTSVDKANVLATSRLWRTVADEIAREYPDIALDHQLVDSCAMLLVRRPADFDVIVTENLFGDILSDEAAGAGRLDGDAPVGVARRARTDHGTFGLYEPIHGSAPDIAARTWPTRSATILSAAMLLRLSLGRDDGR